MALLSLAVCTIALANWFSYIGLRHLPASEVGLYHYLIPAFGVGLAVAYLGEGVTLATVLGAGLILGGVALAPRTAWRREPGEHSRTRPRPTHRPHRIGRRWL